MLGKQLFNWCGKRNRKHTWRSWLLKDLLKVFFFLTGIKVSPPQAVCEMHSPSLWPFCSPPAPLIYLFLKHAFLQPRCMGEGKNRQGTRLSFGQMPPGRTAMAGWVWGSQEGSPCRCGGGWSCRDMGVQALRELQTTLPAGKFTLGPAMTPTAFVSPAALFSKSIMHYL